MRRPHVVPLAVGFAILSGCEHEPVAPDARVPSDRTASSTPNAPSRISNSVKYRDTGSKPATGRQGSASLTTRALLGRDGTTRFEFTTGEFDTDATPSGSIDRIQLKLLDDSGRVSSTADYNNLRGGGGYRSLDYPGLVPGTSIGIQANVSGVDHARTAVISLVETVKLRPDLSVHDLTPLYQAPSHLPLAISATVRERNGEVGARADCILYVDDVEVDRAVGIWVDAGGSVTCAFSHAFSSPGSHSVQVAVEATTPADWDPANNASERGSIVIREPTTFAYDAFVSGQEFFARSFSSRYDWTYGDTITTWYSESEQRGYEQTTEIRAQMLTELRFPIDITIGETNAGEPVFSRTFTELPATRSGGAAGYHWACGDGFSAESVGNVYLTVCMGNTELVAPGIPYTYVNFRRYAGDVTYWSEQITRDLWGTPTYTYSWNYTSDVGTDRPTLVGGTEYAMDIEITHEGTTYSNRATIALDDYRVLEEWPYYCARAPWDDYSYSCWHNVYDAVGVRGEYRTQ